MKRARLGREVLLLGVVVIVCALVIPRLLHTAPDGPARMRRFADPDWPVQGRPLLRAESAFERGQREADEELHNGTATMVHLREDDILVEGLVDIPGAKP